jgi:hypothetical protein
LLLLGGTATPVGALRREERGRPSVEPALPGTPARVLTVQPDGEEETETVGEAEGGAEEEGVAQAVGGALKVGVAEGEAPAERLAVAEGVGAGEALAPSAAARSEVHCRVT